MSRQELEPVFAEWLKEHGDFGTEERCREFVAYLRTHAHRYNSIKIVQDQKGKWCVEIVPEVWRIWSWEGAKSKGLAK